MNNSRLIRLNLVARDVRVFGKSWIHQEASVVVIELTGSFIDAR
jgi:hypothetical protein